MAGKRDLHLGLHTHMYDPMIQFGARFQCLNQRLWPQMVLSGQATPQPMPQCLDCPGPQEPQCRGSMFKLGSCDSILTRRGSKQSLGGQKGLLLIQSELPHLFFFRGESFLCSSKSSLRWWNYFPISGPRSCNCVCVSDLRLTSLPCA